jgi:hypothetical protein
LSGSLYFHPVVDETLSPFLLPLHEKRISAAINITDKVLNLYITP